MSTRELLNAKGLSSTKELQNIKEPQATRPRTRSVSEKAQVDTEKTNQLLKRGKTKLKLLEDTPLSRQSSEKVITGHLRQSSDRVASILRQSSERVANQSTNRIATSQSSERVVNQSTDKISRQSTEKVYILGTNGIKTSNGSIKTNDSKESLKSTTNLKVSQTVKVNSPKPDRKQVLQRSNTSRPRSHSDVITGVLAEKLAQLNESRKPKVVGNGISKSQKQWSQLLSFMKALTKMKEIYNTISLKVQSKMLIPVKEVNSFYNEYKSTIDTTISTRIQTLLLQKTRESINQLDQLLKYRVKAYSQFSLDKRLKLCKIMRYEAYPPVSIINKETLVCLEGQQAQYYYFLLSGRVEICSFGTQRTRVSFINKVNCISAGESFGRLQLVNDIRMASVATIDATEFLVIDKKEFIEATRHTTSELKEQLTVLQSLPHFNTEFLTKANMFFEISMYSPNDAIITQNTHDHRIYFILSGNCIVTKTIPIKIQGVEQMVDFEIQELERGNHFPGLPLNAVQIKESSVLQETGDLLLRTDTDPYISEYTVTATTTTEIAMILKTEYIKLATIEMIQETLRNKNLVGISCATVQEGVKEQVDWLQYKKNLVDGLRRS